MQRGLKMAKEDARIVRTKNDLRNGLLTLLKIKNLERISVKEICEETSINKMTFYKHYDDKYDLLDDCVKHLAETIIKEIQPNYIEAPKEDYPDLLARFALRSIDTCLEHKDVIISISQCSNSLGVEVVKSAVETVIENFLSSMSDRFRFKYEKWSISAFLSGGFAALVMRVVHEGSYDRKRYYYSFRAVIEASMSAHIVNEDLEEAR